MDLLNLSNTIEEALLFKKLNKVIVFIG